MPTPVKVFFVCWIALGIASWFFYAKATYKTKKAVHPFLMIAVGVVFIGFVEWITGGKVPWFFIVAVGVIMFLNVRLMQFCPRCSATVYPQGFLSRPNFCPKCGAELP
jgi:ribosomal protein S27AE